MNAVTIFTTPEALGSQGIRITDRQGNPWFATPDIARVLGRSNNFNLLKNLADDEKGHIEVMTPGGRQKISFVSESGLYRILMRSNSPRARAVLPAIRKDGGCIVGEEKVRSGEMSSSLRP